MENLENTGMENTEAAENISQQVQETDREVPVADVDSSYHAEGVGQKEAVAPDSPEGFHSYEGQGVYTKPETPQPRAHRAETRRKPKPRKKWFLKFLCTVLAAVLVVALVFTSCGVTALVMGLSWNEQMRRVTMNFEEKLQILRDELEEKSNILGGEVIVPSEGMTPAQVYDKTLDSVVAVTSTVVTSGGAFGESYTSISAGSGFILTSDGYIVTNHHVIAGGGTIHVITAREEQYKARIIGSDASNDIALLKIEAKGLQAAKIGSSDALPVGSQVVAIGNALGELSFSLTVGHVSGKDRTITTDGAVINMLQTDVAINSGNSGGPLFNMNGEVIGINSAKYSGTTSSGASIEGISFAIPIDDVLGMLEDLRDYGYITGVKLGVMVRNLDDATVEVLGFSGVFVESVLEGSCAEKAGIRDRDIILEVGGYEIEHMNDLTRALRKFEAGQEGTIKIWRSGREVLLIVVFDSKN